MATAGRLALRHDAPLTWHSRHAPLSLSAPRGTWRERAARHRECLGLPAPARAGRDRAASGGPCRPGQDAAVVAAGAEQEAPPRSFALLPEPEEVGEGEDGQWWGSVMRVDLALYLQSRNAQLSASARECSVSNPDLENTSVWSIVCEALALERSALRRGNPASAWPDTMRCVDDSLSQAKAEHLQQQLEFWISALEEALFRGDAVTSDALRALPVGVLLRQLLADLRIALGDVMGACEALVRAVSTGPGLADPFGLPLLVGWEDLLDCGYCRAQQCARFGRIALLAAHQAVSAGGKTAAMARQGAASARRHLLDARRLYDAEYATHSRMSTGCWHDTERWCLVLRCARLGSTALLAEACHLCGRSTEAETALAEALHEAGKLWGHAAATPRLKRLLAAEQRLWASGSLGPMVARASEPPGCHHDLPSGGADDGPGARQLVHA